MINGTLNMEIKEEPDSSGDENKEEIVRGWKKDTTEYELEKFLVPKKETIIKEEEIDLPLDQIKEEVYSDFEDESDMINCRSTIIIEEESDSNGEENENVNDIGKDIDINFDTEKVKDEEEEVIIEKEVNMPENSQWLTIGSFPNQQVYRIVKSGETVFLQMKGEKRKHPETEPGEKNQQDSEEWICPYDQCHRIHDRARNMEIHLNRQHRIRPGTADMAMKVKQAYLKGKETAKLLRIMQGKEPKPEEASVSAILEKAPSLGPASMPDCLLSDIKLFFQRSSYKCDFCEQEFRTVSDFRSHTRIEHKGHKAFGCKACPGRYESLWELQVHYEKTHGIITGRKKKTFQCTDCGDIFYSLGLQKIHKPKCTASLAPSLP